MKKGKVLKKGLNDLKSRSPDKSKEERFNGEDTEEFEHRIRLEREKKTNNQTYQIEEFYNKYLM